MMSKILDVGIEMLITSATGGLGAGQYTVLNNLVIAVLQGLH
jgi:hypothetical protein